MSLFKPGKYEYRDISVEGDLYLRRHYIAGVKPSWANRKRGLSLPGSLYLHEFFRPDRERWLHNHPFWAGSYILEGGYVEERLRGTCVYAKGDFNLITPDTFHRISYVEPGTKTLFFVCRRNGLPYKEGWGFLTDRGYITLRQYEELLANK